MTHPSANPSVARGDERRSGPRPLPGGGRSGGPLVVGLVALGCCLAAFAVWFQWQQTRRCLAFYGPEVAAAISDAPRVELWELKPAKAGPILRAVRTFDASRAPGLVHLRRGLVEDVNFAWTDASGPDRLPASDWTMAIVFFQAVEAVAPTAVVAVACDDEGHGFMTVPGRPGRVALGRIGKGLRSWLEATRATATTAGETAENREKIR